MQCTINLNSREIELIKGALQAQRTFLLTNTAQLHMDELKMLLEEIGKIINRLEVEADNFSGGTYIDGVRT